MAVTIKSLKEIYESIIDNFNSKLEGGRLEYDGKGVLNTLAYTMAGELYLLYIYTGNQFENVFISTAVEFFLEKWGNDILQVTRKQATSGEGTLRIDLESINTVDTIVPVGTQLSTLTSEVVYSLLEDALIPAGELFITDARVISTVTGVASNLLDDVVLSFTTPFNNIKQETIVQDTVVPGIDMEDIETYRTRVLQKLNRPVQGGALIDLYQWCLEVDTIADAFVRTSPDKAGWVEVFIVSKNIDYGSGKAATEGEVNLVTEYIYNINNRRLTMGVSVDSARLAAVDIKVTDVMDLTTEDQTAITSLILEVINSKRPYIEGLSVIKSNILTISEIDNVVQQYIDATLKGSYSGVELFVDGVLVERSYELKFDEILSGEVGYVPA